MSTFSRTGVTFIICLLIACAGVKSGATQGLYISEVAANYQTPQRFYHTDNNGDYDNWLGSGHVGVAWIEVFNSSARPVRFSDYKLRTWGLDGRPSSVRLVKWLQARSRSYSTCRRWTSLQGLLRAGGKDP